MPDIDKPLPWERQPGETAKAYAQFCLFRDYPYKNKENITIAQIQRHRMLEPVIKQRAGTRNGVKKLSAQYHWYDRAAKYDDHIDEINRQTQEAEIIKMRKLHGEVARAMVKKAAEKLLQITPEEMSVKDAIKMFEIGVRCERLSRGETTENLATEVNDKSGMQGMQSLIKSLQAAKAAREENK